jgi:2'-5' RNA ligase
MSQGHEQVKTIAQRLETELEACGLAKENREFSSHITIGRIRSLKNKDELTAGLSKLEGNVLENPGEFLAGKITLFKSTLTPQGPIYEKLQEINLKTT